MKFSRRTLLVGTVAVAGGGLALTWLDRAGKSRRLAGDGATLEPTAYLQISPGGEIILQVDKAELGQGVVTGFVTLLAEELDVPPDRISPRFAPVHPLFQDPLQLTGESKTMRTRWRPVRETGATARQMLLQAAAARWRVAPGEVDSTGAGAIINRATGVTLTYAELAAEAADLPVPLTVSLRPREQRRYIGGQVPRPDIPAKVTGAARYGLDTGLPGLAIAVIRRPARIGDTVRSHDASRARAMPGVLDVAQIHTGIAVLAAGFWHARRAAAAVDVQWTPGPLAGVSSTALRAAQGRALDRSEGHRVRNDGAVARAFAGAARVLEAEYAVPYLAHAPMEPMNATIWFRAGRCEAWVPSQGPDMVRQVICDMSGLAREQVDVHTTYAGGGFGRRATMEFVVEAVEIAMHAARPVKLVWTREDDMQHGLFREASLHRLRAALAADGTPVAWQHRLTAAGLNALVLPISFAVLAPEWLPKRAVAGTAGGLARLVDRLAGSLGGRYGADSMPYRIPNVQVDVVDWNPGVPVTIWRSVGHSVNGFVVESFADELAHAAGQDPAEFRRRHLGDRPRNLAVLELVLAKAGWGKPAAGRYQGLAVHEAFGTIVGQVAEISIGADNGIRVHRVTCAVDCGTAVNPDIVRQQLEGGIIFGLSAALYGEITLEDGAVRQANFNDYRLLRLADAPAIDVHIVASDADPSGIGEPGVPPIAPAVANAVFAATGQRLRSLPLRLP